MLKEMHIRSARLVGVILMSISLSLQADVIFETAILGWLAVSLAMLFSEKLGRSLADSYILGIFLLVCGLAFCGGATGGVHAPLMMFIFAVGAFLILLLSARDVYRLRKIFSAAD